MTTVSIIIPVYNAANSIGNCIDSVLQQNFSDYELILVDDGSSDNTPEILARYKQADARIVVIRQENAGPSAARNTGLARARGRYIQFYDSDDLVLPGALASAVARAESSNSSVVVSGWSINLQTERGAILNYRSLIPDDADITDTIRLFVLTSLGENGMLYNLWNKLFRADIIRKHSILFREDLRFGEDLLFSLAVFSHATTISLLPQVTYCYTENSGTSVFSTSSLVPEYRQENDKALVRFGSTPPASTKEYDALQWVRWRWLMSYWRLVSAADIPLAQKRHLISSFTIDVKPPRGQGVSRGALLLLAVAIRRSPRIIIILNTLVTTVRLSLRRIRLSLRFTNSSD